jgi:glycosyltransferase involved in cell wall biosynthesis
MRVVLIGSKGDFEIENKGLGIQTYMYELANRLKTQNVDLHLVEAGKLPIGNSLSYFVMNGFRNFNKYDIVHSLDVKPFIPFRKNNKAIWIATIHDFWPILYPDAYIGKKTLKNIIYIKYVVKLGLLSSLKADFLIADSSLTKQTAIEKFGYDKNRIKVVNLGLNEKFIIPLSINKGKKDDGFKVGYIGAFRPNKNLEFAIESFKKVRDKNMSFEIYGAKTFDYKKLVIQSHTDKRIIFKGFLDEKNKVNTYMGFDCFVFPSLYEGFGLPILEAQALGIPVIIYKNALIPKEVRKYCLEAESPEHMAQIIENLKENGYNEKEQEKAIGYARSFTWEKTANETLKVYKKVLE